VSQLRNLGRAFAERRASLPIGYLLMWGGLGMIGVLVIIVGVYYFNDATTSNEFCGLLCHPNRPQYETHQISAHANVNCSTCHVGPGLAPKFTSKIYGAGELFSLITDSYHRPLESPVARLRPADEICEQCHWPTKDLGQRVRRIRRFADDEENTETLTYLLTNLGPNADPRQSYIHWHIDNPVWFVALDAIKQEIPWVAVEKDGQLVEYVDRNSTLTLDQLAQLPVQQMDCLDCHNRAAHQFVKPEYRLDEALASGAIDHTLPFVKREGLRLLSVPYATKTAGLEAMKELEAFYRSQYPQVYAGQQQAIAAAVAQLQTIYAQTTFPEMNLTWNAYLDNSQHIDSPGCFRCHDNSYVSRQGEVITQSCSLCHSVPVVMRGDQRLDVDRLISFALQSDKPQSHFEPRFLSDHAEMVDASCSSCHGEIAYGADNSSFCANEACHAPSAWRGQPSGRLMNALFITHPVQEGMDCLACHGDGGSRPLPPSHEGISDASCLLCHQVGDVAGAPPISHVVIERDNCLACHDDDRLRPVPPNHEGWTNDYCLLCHNPG
jgi:nitrate/TMAO reductase-like tetraheme cytochrome c subunit